LHRYIQESFYACWCQGLWVKLNSKEQKCFIVFGLFFVGISIFWAGIKVGQIIAVVINMQ
jgi:hypothetical protein